MGDDVLTGTNGADVFTARAGNDVIDPLLGADRIDAAAGNDIVRFSSVMSSWPPPSEVGSIDGGIGYDTIDARNVSPSQVGADYSTGNGQLYIVVGSQRFDVNAVECILLGDGNDSVGPPETGVSVYAGGGSDWLSGAGDIQLYGEGGNDTFFIGGTFGHDGSGVIDGGEGDDTLILNIAFTLDLTASVGQAGGTTYAVTSFETIYTSADSKVVGSDASETIAVYGVFDLNFFGNQFDGRGGDDVLSSSSGNDVVAGGDGDDHIRGNAGSDILTGGAGCDTFVFDADDSAPATPDTITDFDPGMDRIDLSAIDTDPSTVEHDRLRFIGRRAFDGVAGEVRFEREGHATLVQIDLDGDGEADQAIQLTGRFALRPANFILKPESDAAAPHLAASHAHDAFTSTHLGLSADLP